MKKSEKYRSSRNVLIIEETTHRGVLLDESDSLKLIPRGNEFFEVSFLVEKN